MRNILKLWSLFLLGALFIVSCSKEDGTFQNLQASGSILSFTNVVTGFYDLGDLANASIAFDMDSHGDAVTSVKILKSFNGGASVEHAVINTTPSTVTISIADAVDGLGVSEDDLVVGDEFTYSFEITNALGVSRSGKTQVIPVSCNSALIGTWDYTTTSTWCGSPTLTGTVEWTEAAAGIYEISDWAYGAYEDCYGGAAASWGTLQLTDVCNKITQIGEDAYGDTWTFNITSVDGPDLNFTWDNTYGENGTVKLSRTDGTDWPPLIN